MNIDKTEEIENLKFKKICNNLLLILIGLALQKACDNYVQIYKAVKFIRSEIFSNISKFDGSFPVNCQEIYRLWKL